LIYSKKAFVLFITLCLILSCHSRNKLQDFDRSAWIAELSGCGGERIKMVPVILSQKESLNGLQQPEIIAILGNPDEHELYSRNQKFFTYYTSCSDSLGEDASYLKLRFNALGQLISVVHYE
jgi:hypothetical protein